MPRTWIIRISVAVSLLSSTACFGKGEFVLMHDGNARTYDLHVPGVYRSGSPLPLLIALHGRSGNAKRMAELTGFNTLSDRHGFIVLYPESLKGTWNYLHGIAGYTARPNDSDFLLTLLEKIGAEYSIDQDRVFVAGISNGGFMAQRLACEASHQFAAFASVAAGGYGAMSIECREYQPVSMLYVHGTEDTLVPWQGLRITDAGGNQQLVTMSIADSLKFWSQRNHCGPEVTSSELPQSGNSPGTLVQFLTAKQCQFGAEVSLYAILGGGHNWPGNRDVIPPDIAGAVNMDIQASEVIWEFFERNARGK